MKKLSYLFTLLFIVLNGFALAASVNTPNDLGRSVLPVYDVRAFGLKGDYRALTGLTLGTPPDSNLIASTSQFTSADVGKRITILGAGVSGANLVTTISAYVSGTNVTLAAPNSTAVSLVNGYIGSANVSLLTTNFSIYSSGTYNFSRGNYFIDSSLTIPSNVKLQFEPGAKLVTSAAITWNGMIDADLKQQIVSLVGSGSVSFSQENNNPSINWLGATGNDSSDDTTAINNTIASLPAEGGVVRFPGGTFYTTSSISPGDKAYVRFEGLNGFPNNSIAKPTVLYCSAVSGPTFIVNTGDDVQTVEFVGIKVDGSNGLGIDHGSTTWSGFFKNNRPAEPPLQAKFTKINADWSMVNNAVALDLRNSIFTQVTDCDFSHFPDGYGVRAGRNGNISTMLTFDKTYFHYFREDYKIEPGVSDIKFTNCSFESSIIAGTSVLTKLTFDHCYWENMGYDIGAGLASPTSYLANLPDNSLGVGTDSGTDVDSVMTDKYSTVVFNQCRFAYRLIGSSLTAWFHGEGGGSTTSSAGNATFNQCSYSGRNPTLTTTVGTGVTFASGALTSADSGKEIMIATANADGSDYYGTFTYSTSTSGTLSPAAGVARLNNGADVTNLVTLNEGFFHADSGRGRYSYTVNDYVNRLSRVVKFASQARLLTDGKIALNFPTTSQLRLIQMDGGKFVLGNETTIDFTAAPTTAPVTGAYVVGDFTKNQTRGAGTPFGWVCTTAGGTGVAVWTPTDTNYILGQTNVFTARQRIARTGTGSALTHLEIIDKRLQTSDSYGIIFGDDNGTSSNARAGIFTTTANSANPSGRLSLQTSSPSTGPIAALGINEYQTTQVLGSLEASVSSQSSTFTLTNTAIGAFAYLVSGTSTMNLPAASGATNRVYLVKNVGVGTVTIDPNSTELIDGASTITLAAGEAVTIVCSGTAWQSMNRRIVTETDPLSLHTTASGLTANKYIGTDGSGNIVVKTDPLTSESDPSSLHTVGGIMTGDVQVSGSHNLGTALSPWSSIFGKSLHLTTGTSDATMGTAAFSGGTTVVVNTTAVTNNSIILVTTQQPSGMTGALYIFTRSAGTSFTIGSTVATNDTVGWVILEPN